MSFATRSSYTHTVPAPVGGGITRTCTPSNHASVIAAAQPGDVVVFENGTYHQLWLEGKNGTAGAPITFVARNQFGAVFTSGPSDAASCWVIRSNYLTVRGVRIVGNGVHSTAIGMPSYRYSWLIGREGPCKHLRFYGCEFDNSAGNEANVIVQSGTRFPTEAKTGDSWDATYRVLYNKTYLTENVLFEDCYFNRSRREHLYLAIDAEPALYETGAVHDVTVRRCEFVGQEAEAIDNKFAYNVLVEDCVFRDAVQTEWNASGCVIHYQDKHRLPVAFDWHVQTVRRCRFWNLKTANGASSGAGAVSESNAIWVGTANVLIENNVFWDITRAAIYCSDNHAVPPTEGRRVRIRNNTVFGTGLAPNPSLLYNGQAPIQLHNHGTGGPTWFDVRNNVLRPASGTTLITGARAADIVENQVYGLTSDFYGPTSGTADRGLGPGSGLEPPPSWSRTSTVTAQSGTSTDVYGRARDFTPGLSEPGAWEVGGVAPPPPPPPPDPDPVGYRTPVLVASGGAKSGTVSFPADVQVSDVLVVYALGPVRTQNGAVPGTISGSGWTTHVDAIGDATQVWYPHHALFTKVATVAGAQSYTVSIPGDASVHHLWMLWRDVDPANRVDAAAVGAIGYKPSGQAPAGPAVTTTTPNTVVLTFVGDESNSAVAGPPSGFTAAAGSYVGYRGLWHAYDVRETPGATGVLTWANGFTANSNHSTATIGLRPLGNSPSVSPTGFVDGPVFGSPTVSRSSTVAPSGVAAGAVFGSPTVTAASTVAPVAVAAAAVFGVPALSLFGGVQAPVIYGIAPTVAFGAAYGQLGVPQTVLVSDLENHVRFGEPEAFRNYTMTWLAWVARGIDSGQ